MIMKKTKLILLIFLTGALLSFAQDVPKIFPGADESTPSRSQYFSWISNTNEGTTTGQSLINLEFSNLLQIMVRLEEGMYA